MRGTSRGDRVSDEARTIPVAAGEPGPEALASPNLDPGPLADVVAEIRETHRMRQDFHSAEKRLTNQIKAIARRMSAVPTTAGTLRRDDDGHAEEGEGHPAPDDHEPLAPALPADSPAGLVAFGLAEARAVLAGHRKRHEKRMAVLAKQLPVWAWVEKVRGVGPLGLAQLVGECGDIGTYANPAKLWKRMGVAVINGERQRRVAGDAALLHGYSPTRRSILYNLGVALLKQNKEGDVDGPYRALYLKKKAMYAARPPCGNKAATGYVCVNDEGTGCAAGHVHNRARRVMEKEFLVDLWASWRREARRTVAA